MAIIMEDELRRTLEAVTQERDVAKDMCRILEGHYRQLVEDSKADTVGVQPVTFTAPSYIEDTDSRAFTRGWLHLNTINCPRLLILTDSLFRGVDVEALPVYHWKVSFSHSRG